jgi:hypothetical protein
LEVGVPVDLKKLAEAFDLATSDWEEFGSTWFVEKKTGAVWEIPGDLVVFIEDHDELFDDAGELVQGFEAILEAAELDYLDAENLIKAFTSEIVVIDALESREQYRIMERFIDDLEDERAQELLYVAIDGKGAFRRFKDTAHYLGLIEDYYRYKDAALLKEARSWCEANELEYS